MIMIRIEPHRRWRVTATKKIDLPLPASVVWGQMRDLRRFITMDPLHAKVRDEVPTGRAIPAVGTRLVIEHRLAGLRVLRRSRLLYWREGRGYAVSDLSRRGHHAGFPHVCEYEIMPVTERSSSLRLSVRGRWTATWMPVWMVRIWLMWVMYATGQRMENALLAARDLINPAARGTGARPARPAPRP